MGLGEDLTEQPLVSTVESKHAVIAGVRGGCMVLSSRITSPIWLAVLVSFAGKGGGRGSQIVFPQRCSGSFGI